MKTKLLSIVFCFALAVQTFGQVRSLNKTTVENISTYIWWNNFPYLTNLMHADAAAQVAAAISEIATNTGSTNGVTGAQLTAAIAVASNNLTAVSVKNTNGNSTNTTLYDPRFAGIGNVGDVWTITNATTKQGTWRSVTVTGVTNSAQGYVTVNVIGDSLAYGYGGIGTNIESVIETNLNVVTTNLGIGGQTIRQTAVRLGVYPVSVTVSNSVIPAAGSTCLLNFGSTYCPANAAGGFFIWGSIAGVYGYLSYTSDGMNAWFVPLTNATPVTVTGSTNWLSDSSMSLGDLNVFWVGRNDIGADVTSIRSNFLWIDALTGTNSIYMSIMPWAVETNGTTGWQWRTNMNTWLSQTFSNRFVDPLPALQAAATTNAQDVLDVQGDITPTSLRFDNGHLNGNGYLIAGRLAATAASQLLISHPYTMTRAGNSIYLTRSLDLKGVRTTRLLTSNLTVTGQVKLPANYIAPAATNAAYATNSGTASNATVATLLVNGSNSITIAGDGFSWQVRGHLMTYPDNTFDFGNDTYRARNGFFRGYVIADHFYGTVNSATAANTAAGLSVSNSTISRAGNGNFDVNTNLISTTGRNLGQPEYKWGTLYVTNVNAGILSGSGLIVSRSSAPSLAEIGGTGIACEWYSTGVPPIFYVTYYDANSNEVTKGWTTNTWMDITNYVNADHISLSNYSVALWNDTTSRIILTNNAIIAQMNTSTQSVYAACVSYINSQTDSGSASIPENLSTLTNYFVTTDSNVTFYMGTNPNSTVTVYTNGSVVLGTNVICISPNGKIGLGVASPTYSLQSDSDIYTGHGNISTAYGNISTTGGHIDSTWMRANYFSATNAVYAKNIIVTNGVQFLSLSNTPGVLSVDSSGNVSAGPQTNGFYSTRGNGTAPTQVTETPVQDGGVYQVTYVNTNSQSQQVWWSGMCALIIVNPGANGLPQYVNVTSLVTTNYNFNYIATNSVSFHCILQQNESVQVWYPTWNTTIYKDSFFVKDL